MAHLWHISNNPDAIHRRIVEIPLCEVSQSILEILSTSVVFNAFDGKKESLRCFISFQNQFVLLACHKVFDRWRLCARYILSAPHGNPL